jgi:hypothetical protein
MSYDHVALDNNFKEQFVFFLLNTCSDLIILFFWSVIFCRLFCTINRLSIFIYICTVKKLCYVSPKNYSGLGSRSWNGNRYSNYCINLQLVLILNIFPMVKYAVYLTVCSADCCFTYISSILTVSRDFRLSFFVIKLSPLGPDSLAKVVSNMDSNSPRIS